MVRALLFVFLGVGCSALSVQQKSASSYIPKPVATTWEFMEDKFDEKEVLPIALKDWPGVSVMIYKKFRLYDGVHSGKLFTEHAYDQESVAALCDAYKKHGAKGAILDIGANIGGYTMPLASCLKSAGGSSLIAVEAMPKNNEHLRTGIKYNNLTNVRLYEYAVGAGKSEDTLDMGLFQYNMGMPRVVSPDGDTRKKTARMLIGTNAVPSTTIDAILQQAGEERKAKGLAPEGIFALKMDIEEYEPIALQGATKFFKDHRPCIVFIELKATKELLVPFFESHDYIRTDAVNTTKTEKGIDAWFQQKDMEKCVKAL